MQFTVWGVSGTLEVADAAFMPLAEATLTRWTQLADASVNRFLDSSEITAINAAPLATHRVSDTFVEFFRAAQTAAALTDGLCDPTVLDALEAWGFRDDFALVATQAHTAPHRSVAARGLDIVELNSTTNELATHGARLDFGSSAKAYVADAIAETVGHHTSVLVELGGDVAIGGPAPITPWAVGVAEDPEHRGGAIGLVSGGVATSSTLVRSWSSDTVRASHIIDPRTGRPTDGPWRTVSVAASSCLVANAFSTAALLWGDDAPYYVTQAGWAARFVRLDGTTLTVGGWPEEGAQ